MCFLGMRSTPNEHGTSTIEAVGLATAIAILAAALSLPLAHEGPRAAHGVARSIVAAVDGDTLGASRRRSARQPGITQLADVATVGQRVSGIGANPPSLSGSRIRGPATSGVPSHQKNYAVKRGESHVPGGRLRWCVVCAGGSVSFEPTAGTRAQAEGASLGSESPSGQLDRGVGGQTAARAQLAIAAAEVATGFKIQTGWGGARGRAAISATLGATGHATADATFTRHRQAVNAGVDGYIGGVVRAEEQGSLTILGVTLEQTAGAEGWAGAGGRARIRLDRDGGKLTVGAAGGAAWGLGGAVDAQVTIDATRLLRNPQKALAPLLSIYNPNRAQRRTR